MIVVVVIFVMTRPRIEIVFGCGPQAEHDARVDTAFGDIQHWNAARRFRQHSGARRGEFAGIDQIGLVENHDVGAGDLIFEHFTQRSVVIDALVGKALPRDRREIGREAAVGDGFGVGHGDHTVNRDAGSQIRPFERFQ
jgi:hypothetical protein